MIKTRHIELETNRGMGVSDITDDVGRIVSECKVKEGICTIFAIGSTCAITTIEFEPGLVSDMENAMERLFPENMTYEHEKRWHDGNGHSHLRASFLGQSFVVPVMGGKPILGTWQQIVFIELDNKPRTRTVMVQGVGD